VTKIIGKWFWNFDFLGLEHGGLGTGLKSFDFISVVRGYNKMIENRRFSGMAENHAVIF
jgi:hypothetical protein